MLLLSVIGLACGDFGFHKGFHRGLYFKAPLRVQGFGFRGLGCMALFVCVCVCVRVCALGVGTLKNDPA